MSLPIYDTRISKFYQGYTFHPIFIESGMSQQNVFFTLLLILKRVILHIEANNNTFYGLLILMVNLFSKTVLQKDPLSVLHYIKFIQINQVQRKTGMNPTREGILLFQSK